MFDYPNNAKELRECLNGAFDAAQAAARAAAREARRARRRTTPMPGGEYLSIAETAVLVGLSDKTVRNQMRKTITRRDTKTGTCRVTRGAFEEGVHWFRPAGGAPRFKKSSLIVWIEARTTAMPAASSIPAGRAYVGLQVDRRRRRA